MKPDEDLPIAAATNQPGENLPAQGIAVIGMAGRFPGAKDIDEFWQNLCDGVEAISFFSDQELDAAGIDPALFNRPEYVRAKFMLEDPDLFDASFFGFTAREAEITDPQHRLFLECAWEALEHAGYDSEAYQGPIGVYAGVGPSDHLLHNIYQNHELLELLNPYQLMIGNDKDFVTTRVAYKLNLRGPGVTVQTACSTSLVAVHLACQSLLSYQCDMVLAGGVSIRASQKGYIYQEGGVLSPDGRCRAFDARAQGTASGEGVAIVVLKRLEDALADGDSIHAVIRGSAINNDGAAKIGYTAPGVDGQAEVIVMAQAVAGVDAETIGYIETHGTGTPLGDPIEITALTQAFRASTDKNGFCAIGSLKPNVGHMDTAAGAAGLLKAVLALEHKLIPPSLLFEHPNPKIDFTNSPFYVNTQLAEWPAGVTPRRAGVSAFGLGGTNAHAVLEEAPVVESERPARPWQLLVLSAKTESALEVATARLSDYLQQHPDTNLADAAYTLQLGRRGFGHRRMVVCRDLDDAVTALDLLDDQRVYTASQKDNDRSVVFMFPGGGAQHMNMGAELYQLEPVFREQVDRCAELLKPQLGLDLRDMLYPTAEQAETVTRQLENPSIALPSLFVIEYALAKLWNSWGVRPRAMIGHSLGEYVAACLAGVFALEDALALVALRGRLFEELPAGAMLSIPLPEEELLPLLNQNLSLAAINAPALCVVSGPADAITDLAEQLHAKGITFHRLHIAAAGHSEMVAPILATFTRFVETLRLSAPSIPYVSNVTGTWITAEEATDPGYWARHLRQTVRFSQGLQTILEEPAQILLEVGPGQTLRTIAGRHPAWSAEQPVLSSLRHARDSGSEAAFVLNTLGQLWLAGAKIDWAGLHAHEQRLRVPLPTYPFERQRYRIEPVHQTHSHKTIQRSFDKQADIADWFYAPIWKQTLPPTTSGPGQAACWLVFGDTCGLGTQLARRLVEEGHDVVMVWVGDLFDRLRDDVYIINPGRCEDYESLFDELRERGKIPRTICHLWNVTAPDRTPSGLALLEQSQATGFYSLLFLAQTLERLQLTEPLHLGVVSNNIQAVTGDELLCPEKATLLGPCKVIPQEYAYLTCSSIDIVVPEPGTRQAAKLIELLLGELARPSDPIVAYRGEHRWAPTFEPVRLESEHRRPRRLREAGVYLITGGLGGMGLAVAGYLAQHAHARLVLTGRSAFPERAEWAQWLAAHGEQDAVSRKIRRLQSIEQLGAELLVLSADITDLEQMQAALDTARERFGAIHGVIHAAGVAGGGMIQLRTPERAGQVLAPKVRGALVLDELFKDTPLDFLVICSSLASILSMLGHVDYCAANIFLDVFARRSAARGTTFTVSINWDTWREVGMAVDTDFSPELRRWRDENIEHAILPHEGVDAFARILDRELNQVFVSTRDLQTYIEHSKGFTAANLLEKVVKNRPMPQAHQRPELKNAYAAPRDELEEALAEIWQKQLGIERVGVHDNFFELGGDSLLAIQLIPQMNTIFQVEVKLQSLIEIPTITGHAQAIVEARAERDKHRFATSNTTR